MTPNISGPVQQAERITILDSLRGIAILGILMMNIPGFALPEPLCHGDLTLLKEGFEGINLRTWLGIELTIEGTQRALFSILFGAGIILFIRQKEKHFEGLEPADYFFRRQLWLLMFGLFNAYVLLWFWDILFQYAIAGMILFPFRKLKPKYLILAAVVCFGIQVMRDNVIYFREKELITSGLELAQRDTTVQQLNTLEKEKFEAWSGMKEKSTFESEQKEYDKSLAKVHGDYAEFYEYHSERSLRGELYWTYNGIWGILIFMFWEWPGLRMES